VHVSLGPRPRKTCSCTMRTRADAEDRYCLIPHYTELCSQYILVVKDRHCGRHGRLQDHRLRRYPPSILAIHLDNQAPNEDDVSSIAVSSEHIWRWRPVPTKAPGIFQDIPSLIGIAKHETPVIRIMPNTGHDSIHTRDSTPEAMRVSDT